MEIRGKIMHFGGYFEEFNIVFRTLFSILVTWDLNLTCGPDLVPGARSSSPQGSKIWWQGSRGRPMGSPVGWRAWPTHRSGMGPQGPIPTFRAWFEHTGEVWDPDPPIPMCWAGVVWGPRAQSQNAGHDLSMWDCVGLVWDPVPGTRGWCRVQF